MIVEINKCFDSCSKDTNFKVKAMEKSAEQSAERPSLNDFHIINNQDLVDESDIGYIYCLYNPAFTKAYGENIYKFGLARDPSGRLNDYTTPYADPSYFIHVSECVYNCRIAESLLFKRLQYSRLKNNREFFWCRSDLIKKLFIEIVHQVNNGKKFDIPPPNIGWPHIGVIPHIQLFINQEFSRSEGNRTSGSKVEEMYILWCRKKNCRPLDNLNNSLITMDYKVSIGNDKWWIYDLKPQSTSFFVENYIAQRWKIIPVTTSTGNQSVVQYSWEKMSNHFKFWYTEHFPDREVPFEMLWQYLQKTELKCHWPVGAIENMRHVVNRVMGESFEIKLLSEIKYDAIEECSINIFGLQQVLTSIEAFQVYLNQETREGDIYSVLANVLYSSYANWSRHRHYEIIKKESFAGSLKNKGFITKGDYIQGIKLNGDRDHSDFIVEYVQQYCIVYTTFRCKFNEIFDDYVSKNPRCEKVLFENIINGLGYTTIRSNKIKWIERITIKEKVTEVVIPLKTYLKNNKFRVSTLTQLQKELSVQGRIKYKLSLLLVCCDDNIISYPSVDSL